MAANPQPSAPKAMEGGAAALSRRGGAPVLQEATAETHEFAGEAARAVAQRRWAWTISLAIFALGSAFLLWACREEIGAAVAMWTNSSTFGHAFLIFPISLFLIYRKRDELGRMTPRATPLGVVAVAAVTMAWMLGELANIMMVKQLAFVALWQSLFLASMGWRITRAALFPLGYLFLAVPLGSEIIPQLQDVTAQIVVYLLRLTGMPVFLDGYYIQIPSGSFLVAEACSGLRFLIVCIALGALIAYLFFQSWPKRLLFVCLSVIVPVIANGLRAYGIIMLAHLSDYRLAADVDHVIYGFIFLSMVVLTLVGLAALLRDRDSRSRHAEAVPVHPLEAVPPRTRSRSVIALRQTFVPALAVALVFVGQSWTNSVQAPPQDSPTLQPPVLPPEWTAIDGVPPAWTAQFTPADATLFQGYSDGTSQVDLQVAYYGYQREGAEALSELNSQLAGRSDWQLTNQQVLTLRVGGRDLPMTELVISNRGERRLVWYWYWIGGEWTNSRIFGKLLEIKAVMLGQGRAAAVVTLSTEMPEGRETAAAVLERFVKAGLERDADLVQVKR